MFGLRAISAAARASVSGPLPEVTPGQVQFAAPGTTTFIVPEGVTSISAVAIGGGGGGKRYVSNSGAANIGASGAGGGLAWMNNIPVTPGEELSIVVGAGGTGTLTGGNGFPSTILRTGGISLAGAGGGAGGASGGNPAGGAPFVGSGGVGGSGRPNNGTSSTTGGGGGAGGYTGNGGAGGASGPGTAGAGGGAGGGSYNVSSRGAGGGGGTGFMGAGSSGIGGVLSGGFALGGGAGSGGTNGVFGSNTNGNAGIGGLYGGGGGSPGVGSTGGNGQYGAIRIMWGQGRTYPYTAFNALLGGPTTLDTSPTWNNATSDPTFSNGDRTASMVGGTPTSSGSVRSLISKSTGVFYYEATCTAFNTGFPPLVGFVPAGFATTTAAGTGGPYSWWGYSTPLFQGAWPNAGGYGTPLVVGDVLGVLANFSTGQVTYFKNGVSMGVVPYVLPVGVSYHAWANAAGTGYPATVAMNFGQSPFLYPQPNAVSWLAP